MRNHAIAQFSMQKQAFARFQELAMLWRPPLSYISGSAPDTHPCREISKTQRYRPSRPLLCGREMRMQRVDKNRQRLFPQQLCTQWRLTYYYHSCCAQQLCITTAAVHSSCVPSGGWHAITTAAVHSSCVPTVS